MLKTCPDPVDVQDIQFKLHCSLKVFDNSELETFPNNCSLVTCASRYGLVFVGSNTPILKVIQSKTVENFNPRDKDISNFSRRSVSLPSVPKHVCVNCDSTLLAVVLEIDNCSSVIFYEVLSFYRQNISVIKEIRLSSSPGVYATEVNWNPALPNVFTVCKSDGSLGNYEIKGNAVDINELPQAAGCTSFCWSPKGKQIAVGSKNGNITQYKPDLKAVKVINSPTFEGPRPLISLCWVSNYQFIGVYQGANDGQANLIVIDAPKTGETSYTNYDDVCYSGCSKTPQFYLILLQHWNMLMVASSNSTELGLLGAVSELWTQWNVPDFARAELPLGADKQDTLPVGMALDIGNMKPMPWGEDAIPPCPYLLMLSHHGILYFFNIVNLKAGLPSICCPPDSINDTSGLGQFVVEVKAKDISSSSGPSQPQPTLTFEPPPPQPQLPIQIPQPVLPTETPQGAFSFAKPIPTQTLPQFSAPQPSVPPIVSLFNKPVDSKPLFGSQVTLTPIKPQQPDPSSSSTPSIFGNSSISLTPITKPQSSLATDKFASIFAALKEQNPVTKTDPEVILVSNQNPIPESPVEEIPDLVPDTPKSVGSELGRTTTEVKAAMDEKVKGETDALLAKMVKDECVSLESELKALIHQGRKININIGSEQEKMNMVEDLLNMQEFIKDIVDVSLGESSEVHALKQNLILSWAWYEEALSRYNISKDETMTLLIKSQPLDSAAEKRQGDIRKIVYYLESQLYQASKALDEQWDKFQDYAKKTYKVQMPTMETIFQSMVRQNAILQKQSYILKDISSRLKHRRLSSNTPSLFLSLNNVDQLEEDLSRLQLDSDDNHRIFYEQSLNRAQKLSFSKRNKLRELLKVRDVSHVTAAKPQLNASISMLKSPTSRSKHIFSILGARMSPVAKPSVIKNLQFSESTPVKLVQEIKPTSVPPNTPAYPDPSKTFTFKEIVLPKSGSLVLSNLSQIQTNSAFVPTIPTPKAFIVPATSGTPATSSLPFSFSSAFTSSNTITPISGKKPESAVNSNKTAVNFGGSGNTTTTTATAAFSSLPTSKPLFAAPSLPSFGADVPPQSLFSFGKSPSESAASGTPKPSSNIMVSTPVAVNTSQTTFSFAKTTPSIASVADSTAKLAVKAPITTSNSKPIAFSTPSSSTTVSLAAPIPITTSKPINFGTTTTGTTTAKTQSANSFTFSFATPTTTSSLFSTAVTTTTTSLFGSIATPSTGTSIFGAKLTTSTDSAVSSTTETVKAPTSVSKIATSFTTAAASSLAANSKSLFSNTPATTSVSIFGVNTLPVSSAKPLFGTALPNTTASAFSPSVAATTSNKSIFSAATSSTPSTTTSPSVFSSTSSSSNTSSGSIFSSSVPSTTGSIFGGITSSVNAPTTTSLTLEISNSTAQDNTLSSSVVSQPPTYETSSAGTKSPSSIFGTPATTPPPPFSTAATTTKASIFSSQPATTQASIFGSAITTQSSTFGSSPTSVSAPVFGSPATTSQSPVFGATTVSSAPIFGGISSTTPASIFGTNTTSTVSAPAPAFGSNSATTQASIFGAAATSAPSVFGATVTTAQSPVFGSPSSSSGSIFGATPISTQASIFGSSAPSSTNPVFGAANTTASSFGSGFGQPSGSIFGGASTFGNAAATTTNQPSSFGGNTSSVFGTPTTASSIFGSGGNAFGGVSSSGNAFGSASSSTFSFASAAGNSLGFGDLNVGSAPASGGSIFGGSPSFGQTAANPFARAPDQKSPFGGSATNTFGTPSSTTGSIFGSNTGSIFGNNSQNTFGTAGFGSPSSFGQQSTFGQSNFGTNSTFGSTQPGPFSGGGVGVGQTGFGSPGSFQKSAGAFGAAPVFGGSPQPAFGANPSFGGSPAFGGAPAFGSPPKAFGSATPAPNFGQSSGDASAGFGNLASQNTVGFGSLAQQAATPTSTAFSGNSSFSSWR